MNQFRPGGADLGSRTERQADGSTDDGPIRGDRCFCALFFSGLHPELPAAAPPGRFVVGSDTDCRELLKRVVDLFRLQQLPILKMIGQPTKSATHNLANHLTVWHKRTQLAAIRST